MPVLKNGLNGDAVKRLQEQLQQLALTGQGSSWRCTAPARPAFSRLVRRVTGLGLSWSLAAPRE
jgi:hypothetical protein